MAPTVLSQIVPTRSPPHWFDIGVQVQRTDGLGVHRLGAGTGTCRGSQAWRDRRKTEITDGSGSSSTVRDHWEIDNSSW
jgi:hypothetical protein